MIEFLSRKRMVLAIIVLFSLTVITLIVEGMWSNNHHIGEVGGEIEGNISQCPSKEKVLEECEPCSALELKMQSSFCEKTGYREKMQCGDQEPKFKSCKLDPRVQERQFWLFELGTCALGLVSYVIVRYRQAILDKQLTEKVNRQIAA